MSSREECIAIVRQLWPYLDGALPEEWQARVADHLAWCTSCRSHFDFEREFLVAVRDAASAADDDVSPLRDRVLLALAHHGFTLA